MSTMALVWLLLYLVGSVVVAAVAQRWAVVTFDPRGDRMTIGLTWAFAVLVGAAWPLVAPFAALGLAAMALQHTSHVRKILERFSR